MNAADIRKRATEVKAQKDADREERSQAAKLLADVEYVKYRGANHPYLKSQVEAQVNKEANLGSFKTSYGGSYKGGNTWHLYVRLMDEIAEELRAQGFRVAVQKGDEWQKVVYLDISWDAEDEPR